MDLYPALDLAVVIIANLVNLVLCLIFLNRVFGRAAWEQGLGYASVVMALPLAVIAAANLLGGRSWAYGLLPLVMVAYLALEYVLDYLLKVNFRQTRLLGPYLLLYYLGLFALIGYAFLAGRLYGFVTLLTYFLNLGATFYSYRKVGY
jgi:hypothetical protein